MEPMEPVADSQILGLASPRSPSGLSEYEKQRQQQIEKNKAFLANLNMEEDSANLQEEKKAPVCQLPRIANRPYSCSQVPRKPRERTEPLEPTRPAAALAPLASTDQRPTPAGGRLANRP